MRDSILVFLGDSITDAGHSFQAPDSKGRRLGNGYVSQIARMLEERCPEDRVRIHNGGHDGFTVRGLLRMLEEDCLRYEPDVVTVLIGSNDAAVCMNTGKTPETLGFEADYRQLLARIRRETKARILCMGPFLFPRPEEYRRWIPVVRRIEQMERETAEAYKARFIPLHEALNRAAEEAGYDRITPDGIHLTEEGAGIVAWEWMNKAAHKIKISQNT